MSDSPTPETSPDAPAHAPLPSGPMPEPSKPRPQAGFPRKAAPLMAPPKRSAQSKPAGWWDLQSLSGTREAVLRAIAASSIPDHWKTALAVELGSVDPQFNFVKLDAHYHVVDGRWTLHISGIPAKGLV